MYLHLGGETVIMGRDIVGIFDIETCSTGKITREFLRKAEDNLQVTSVNEDLPKSFAVCATENGRRVYLSQISSKTLENRLGRFE